MSKDLLFCHGHDSWKVRFSFLSAACQKMHDANILLIIYDMLRFYITWHVESYPIINSYQPTLIRRNTQEKVTYNIWRYMERVAVSCRFQIFPMNGPERPTVAAGASSKTKTFAEAKQARIHFGTWSRGPWGLW